MVEHDVYPCSGLTMTCEASEKYGLDSPQCLHNMLSLARRCLDRRLKQSSCRKTITVELLQCPPPSSIHLSLPSQKRLNRRRAQSCILPAPSIRPISRYRISQRNSGRPRIGAGGTARPLRQAGKCPISTAERLRPGGGHWRLFRDLAGRLRLRGNRLPDAYHAALAMEHGCEWVTLDRGFSIYPGLSVRNLLDG